MAQCFGIFQSKVLEAAFPPQFCTHTYARTHKHQLSNRLVLSQNLKHIQHLTLTFQCLRKQKFSHPKASSQKSPWKSLSKRCLIEDTAYISPKTYKVTLLGINSSFNNQATWLHRKTHSCEINLPCGPRTQELKDFPFPVCYRETISLNLSWFCVTVLNIPIPRREADWSSVGQSPPLSLEKARIFD